MRLFLQFSNTVISYLITKHPHRGVRQTNGTIWCPPSWRLIRYLKQLYSKCWDTSVNDCKRPSSSWCDGQFFRSLSGSGLIEIKNRCMGDSSNASNWTEKKRLSKMFRFNFQTFEFLRQKFFVYNIEFSRQKSTYSDKLNWVELFVHLDL